MYHLRKQVFIKLRGFELIYKKNSNRQRNHQVCKKDGVFLLAKFKVIRLTVAQTDKNLSRSSSSSAMVFVHVKSCRGTKAKEPLGKQLILGFVGIARSPDSCDVHEAQIGDLVLDLVVLEAVR